MPQKWGKGTTPAGHLRSQLTRRQRKVKVTLAPTPWSA
jgi:hypothetical protein